MSETLETGLEDEIQAVAIDIADEVSGAWHLDAYCALGGDPSTIAGRLSAAAQICGIEDPDPHILAVEDVDWVAKSQADLAPVMAGRFFVHGRHDRQAKPVGRVAVEIEAAQAFGSGHHATTRGCLVAFDRLLKRRCPASVLDLGCGSGILAIAAARSTRAIVLAADIDPLAVRIAGENAELNGVGNRVRVLAAPGIRHRAIGAAAPYEVVFANILARPLQSLAPDIASVLATRGHAILSGLTHDQEARVIAAYRLQGLRLEQRLRLAGWSVLTLVSGRTFSGPATPRSGCRRAPARCR